MGQQGLPGDAGPSNTTWIRSSIATSGVDAGFPNKVTLGHWGPFTLEGYCYADPPNGFTAVAGFFISSTAVGSKLTDYGGAGQNTLLDPTTGAISIEYPAQSSAPTVSDLEGPYDGTFAAMSSDLATYITGALTDGVYLAGPSGPACQFGGYVTQSP